MKKKIAILKGDGIGPEIMNEAIKVLEKIASGFDHEFKYIEGLVGGDAYDHYKEHLPKETLEICENSDAILFASVGGPVDQQHLEKWKDCERNSILALRKHFNFFLNIRPVSLYPSLAKLSPLKTEIIQKEINILCLRELLGDVYFGEHKTEIHKGKKKARDVMEYDTETIKRIAIRAFQFAQKRKKKVFSVDKANVLDSSRLWREVVQSVSSNYPDCSLEHILVDNCAMQLIKNPSQFDVLLMPNMFGDILTDEASVLAGSLGLLPSASLNEKDFGLFEPSGGSAQDIALKNIANPIAQILSAAMMLRYSFGMEKESKVIEGGVRIALDNENFTQDLQKNNALSTHEMGDAIVEGIKLEIEQC